MSEQDAREINQRIHKWLYPNLKNPIDREFPADYYNSLDAMAKAEEKLGKDLELMKAYTYAVHSLMFAGQRVVLPDKFFAFMVCPSEVRAEALAEVLNELNP